MRLLLQTVVTIVVARLFSVAARRAGQPSVIDVLRLASVQIVLLPLFFAATGIRTEIALLHDSRAWLVCAAVIAVATIGKLGGSPELFAVMVVMALVTTIATGPLLTQLDALRHFVRREPRAAVSTNVALDD